MGLDTKVLDTKELFNNGDNNHISSYISTLSFYDYLIGSISTTLEFQDTPLSDMSPPKVLAETKKGLYQFVYIGNYKYHLIVATFLIGFALFMTAKRKRKRL